MIDIHAHILSGFDDGAKTVKESIHMIKQTEIGSPEIKSEFEHPI